MTEQPSALDIVKHEARFASSEAVLSRVSVFDLDNIDTVDQNFKADVFVECKIRHKDFVGTIWLRCDGDAWCCV